MSETKVKVGFIGIGTMGWPMALNLLKAGYEVMVYDSDPARMQLFSDTHGGIAATSLAHMAENGFVVTMLPTGQIVREVLTEAEGGAFMNHVKAGTVVIDMSSSEPVGTQELSRKLATMDVSLVDAPVSGALPRATTGTLTIMAGGDDRDAIEAARPLLLTMGNRVFDTGGSGSGHAVKALNNYIAATAYVACSEAVLVAKKFGLDPYTLIDVVNVSTGKCFISEVVMQEHVLDEKFATGFALGLLAKDVKIAAQLCEAVNLDAPLAQLVSERWAQARDTLGYQADNSEAIKAWDTPRS